LVGRLTRNAVRLRKRGAEPLLDAVSEEAWGRSDVGVVPAGIERWGGIGDAAQRAIDAETWRDLTDETPDLISPYPHVVAVDRSPVSGVYAIAGAVRTRSGGIHIEVGYSQKASPTEVVERLLDIVTDANPAALLIDSRSPATVLVPYLAECGIEATVLNTSESAIAAEAFVSAVDAGAGQLTHSGQEILTDSVVAGIKRPLNGGRFTFDCAPGGMITQLVAPSLAHYGALVQAPAVPKKTPLPMTAPPDNDGPSIMTRPF
jgi:hypothetical protein